MCQSVAKPVADQVTLLRRVNIAPEFSLTIHVHQIDQTQELSLHLARPQSDRRAVVCIRGAANAFR